MTNVHAVPHIFKENGAHQLRSLPHLVLNPGLSPQLDQKEFSGVQFLLAFEENLNSPSSMFRNYRFKISTPSSDHGFLLLEGSVSLASTTAIGVQETLEVKQSQSIFICKEPY